MGFPNIIKSDPRRPAPVSAAPSGTVRPQAHLSLYRRIATIFICLTAGTVVLACYVILSRATVVVLSKQEEVRADFIVDVSSRPGGDELIGAVLEKVSDLNQRFPATEASKIEAKASGKVAISSSLDRAQTLIATTRLLTPEGVMFRTKRTVVVPARGTAEVEVEADEPGSSGDVGEATFTIPGLNPDTRKLFSVVSVGTLGGGTRDGRAVTQGGIDAAVLTLKDKLAAEHGEALRQEAESLGIVATGKMISSSVVSSSSDAQAGEEAQDFGVGVKVRTVAVFYDSDGLNKLIAAKLKGELPFGRRLLGVDEAGTSVSLEKADLTSGRANLRVAARGATALSADSTALDPSNFSGVTVDAATKYIEKVDGVSSVSIKVRPFWISRLPDIAEHIKVEVR
jgi:hypothetical protein